MKLVQVKWVDSHSFDSWVDIEQLKDYSEVVHVVSVGWLVNECKETVTITPHVAFGKGGEISQCSGDMTIPRVAITKIRDLPHNRFELKLEEG